MKKNIIRKADGYASQHRHRRIWRKVVGGLACVVVFCTIYALIMPAITMEKTRCGIPEHTHTEDCYTQVTTVTKKEPICTLESLNLHKHTEGCFDENGEPICGYSDFVVHEHDSSCYDEDGKLWCPLSEIKAHTHNSGCYAAAKPVHTHTEDCYTQERGDLICTEEERDGHTHSVEAGCFDENGTLICQAEEETGHQHTDDCYSWDQVLSCGLTETETAGEPELVCGKEEIILHEHSSGCFDKNNHLICGKQQVLEHVHDQACFQTVEEPADTEALTCGLEEHTHTEECNIPAELTEEEQAQVDEVIALIDALPTQEEIEETLEAFEDAEEEDGYDAYLAEIVTQARAAYKAYSALTEAQQAKVTNAAKLMALEPIWSAQTLVEFPALTNDGARVSNITVTSIFDGTAPWDSDDTTGNDSSAENKVVRTFDTVTYNFEVQMESYDSTSYSEARVKLEFVLPLTAEQATFDQGAMAWMDQTAGYAPVLTTEERNGVTCQVLTCYKRLLPSTDHPSVVPGSFGENVTVNVKSMKNGETFAPTFSAAMEKGAWEGDCAAHGKPEKFTVTADEVRVTAVPKYNIQIGGGSSYKSTFDFSTGNDRAQAYGNGYGNMQMQGRVMKLGIVIQLYNDNASKGFKGIELPTGDITFDLNVSSEYEINIPNEGSDYAQKDTIEDMGDKGYLPLLWSIDPNESTAAGSTNHDGRVLYDSHGYAQANAPTSWSKTGGYSETACYNSGGWSAIQDGGVIHVTVKDYEIDVNRMPLHNGDGSNNYGKERGIGCFSAGEVWIVQPFNKEANGAYPGPDYDVVKEYGSGLFHMTVEVTDMKATTVSNAQFADPEGTNGAQIKRNDDRATANMELLLPGSMINRVSYVSCGSTDVGVGVTTVYDSRDFATPGTKLRLLGGFSYNHRNEESNIFYYGTSLTKFYASAIELTDSSTGEKGLSYETRGGGNLSKGSVSVLYATKPDGTDWGSDWELQSTYEENLVFYKSLAEIPQGHKCVGLLYCFKGPDDAMGADPYYYGIHTAKVRDDMSLAGQTFMLASTSRVWTKSMFESAGMTLDNIPDWSDGTTRLNQFPSGWYQSANISGQVYYRKATYAADGSGLTYGGNCSWREWGDTLLVIGYKTEITKNKAQLSEPDVEKNVYNLDYEQRVVDFKLQPSTFYDQGSGNHALTTTVTIVDTLPKFLTYRAGSSYFGGTYTKTSDNGGTQGKITDGTLREPDSVVNNADGTQTLTWIIPNVTVGEEMEPIYYSADIGDRNNIDNDVPTGTTNLTNTVRIYATHDIREPNKDNRNYAEAGIAVTRGTASAFGKYTKQKLVEPDGVIDYVAYFDNNAVTSADVVMLDTMPYNGVNDSHFNGTYVVNSWKLDVSKCDVSKLTLYYTMDTQYKDATTVSLGGNEAAKTVIRGWTQAAIGADGTVTAMNGQKPVAWAILGSLDANKRILVDMQIGLRPDSSTGENKIENNYYVNSLSSGDTTIHTENPTVNRTLEGLTWLDDSADGIQNEAAERRISGVKVTLLKLKDGGDPKKESDYEPYYYPGTSTPIEIETGQQISVRATNADAATNYEQGRYKFTDLPAGTFAVRFEDGSTQINGLIASPSNRGTDDTQDSDGIATYSTDRSSLKQTVILGIEMPKAEEMSVTLYESKYHDSGFYEKGHELPQTGGLGTTPYTIGGLLMLTGAGLLLLFKDKKRRKEDFASS